MAKKRKTARSSKKNLPQNAEWLDDRLDSMMLDLDALASMPIADVKSELSRIAPDAPDLSQAINGRLPEGVKLTRSTSTRKRARNTSPIGTDRPAATRTASRAQFRWLSFRGAMILSGIIILAAIFIPQGIRSLRESPPDPATAVLGDEESPTPPTWIEGPGENELVRGVRYTLEGLEQVAINTPLPANPGSLQTTVRLRITVDAAGNVVNLESLALTPHEIEASVIDSLLTWRFTPYERGEPGEHTGTVTVEFEAR